MVKRIYSIMLAVLMCCSFMIPASAEEVCKHDYEVKVIKSPTCTEKGETLWTCSKCGKIYTEITAALGHYEEFIEEISATCSATGLGAGVKCKHCGLWRTRSYGEYVWVEKDVRTILPIDEDAHKLEWKAIEPTCTENGIKGALQCKYCKLWQVKGNDDNSMMVEYDPREVIFATGHDWKKDVSQSVAATVDCEGKDVYYCAGCGQTYTVVLPKLNGTHTHNYTSEITKQPTCSQPGFKTYTCSCGDSYTEGVSALEHNWKKDVSQSVAATVDVEGKDVYYCTACNEIYTVVLPKLNGTHTHNYTSKITKQPTCTEKGVKTYTCSCGYSYTEVVFAFGHSWKKDVSQSVAATVDCEGKDVYYCAGCGEIYQNVLPKLSQPHNHTYRCVETKSPTCLENGYEKYKCDTCDDEYQTTIIAKGHIPVLDPSVTATCTTAGKTEGKHCSVCGEVIMAQKVIPANGHILSNWQTVKEPSTSETGLKQKICTVCNSVIETVIIPKLGETHIHSYTSEITKQPTCTEKGVKTYTCSCSESYAEEISALGHTEVVDEAVAPTCTEKGLAEGKHCSVCGEVFIKQEEVPAKGHDYKEDVFKYQVATCTEPGYKVYVCSRCGDESKVADVPAQGHKVECVETKNATCTDDGFKIYKCSLCDYSVKEVIKAVGKHTEVVDESIAPNCTEKGLTEGKHCSICGKVIVKQEVVPAKGHKIVTVGKKSATYFANGYTGDKKCSVCDKVIQKGKTIAKLKLKTPAYKYTGDKNKLKVTYKKVIGATGFEVRYKVNGKYVIKNYTANNTITKTITLKKRSYSVQIRSFVKQGSKIAYSDWTKSKTVKVK